jgi:putative peptidoglycan lipid II flippase
MVTPFRHDRQAEATAPSSRTVARAAGLVGLATAISRVLGLLREMVLAHYFGAGRFTDAFYVAYRIPNLLRDLFAEGALSSAFVPTFVAQLKQGGRPQAWRLANLVINAVAVILGIVTLAIYFGARWFVYLQAAGFAREPDKFEVTVQMTRIMAPFLLFVGLAALVMGMLNACGSFFLPAMAPSAFNVCCILAGILLRPFMPGFGLDPIVSMAIGAIIGGAAQFFVQIPAAYREGYRYQPAVNFSDPGLRRIGRLMLPGIIGLSATQINITVDNQLASMAGDGPVSWLNYAFRLMQLPIGIFGVAVATVTLTAVSHHAAEKESDKLAATVSSSLRLAACLTFPATVGLILFREEIVQLLYERGEFLPSDTLQTSQVVMFYGLALFAYSAVKILVPVFYALDDTRTPVRASVMSVAAKIVVNFLLIVPLGFKGLAVATAAASWLNFGLLLRKLYRRLGDRPNRSDLVMYLKIILASVIMGGLALLVFRIVREVFRGQDTLSLALTLGTAIAVALFSIVPLLRLFHVPEATELSGILRRRLQFKRR